MFHFGGPIVVTARQDNIQCLEVGHYWRIFSINRVTGEIMLLQAKCARTRLNWWDRLLKRKSREVVFCD